MRRAYASFTPVPLFADNQKPECPSGRFHLPMSFKSLHGPRQCHKNENPGIVEFGKKFGLVGLSIITFR